MVQQSVPGYSSGKLGRKSSCGPLHTTSATIAIDALHLSKYLDGVTLVESQTQVVVFNVVGGLSRQLSIW